MSGLLNWLNANDRRKGWRIAVIALVVLSAGLGLRDPWPPDEPALALMSKTMADSGEWLIPYLAGEPFAGHPPFAIWLQAAFYDATRSMRLSFLLPALLASLGTLWLIYDLAKTLWGPRTGRLAATALLCSFQFMVQAHQGHVDAVLMFWTTLAMYCLLQYMLVEPARRWLSIAGLAMGLGVLTKGVGYLPALMLLPYIWMLRQRWPDLPQGRSPRDFWALLPTFAFVVLAWALPALGFVSGADDEALDQFRQDLLINLAGGASIFDPRSGGQPWWYLPVQALVLWLPLTLMLPWKFRVWRDRLRARDPLIGLLLGYILLTLGLFSLLPGKHGVQLLILLPATALVMAPYMGGLWWRPGVQRLSVAVLWLLSLGAIALGLIGHEQELWEGQVPYPADVPNLIWNFLLTLGVTGIVISLVLRGRPRALGLPTFFFVGWLMLGYWAYPSLNEVRTSKVVFEEIETLLPDGARLATTSWTPQLELFASRPLRRLASPDEARRWLAADADHWLLADRRLIARLIAESGRQWHQHDLPLRHRTDWVLARPVLDGPRPRPKPSVIDPLPQSQ